MDEGNNKVPLLYLLLWERDVPGGVAILWIAVIIVGVVVVILDRRHRI